MQACLHPFHANPSLSDDYVPIPLVFNPRNVALTTSLPLSRPGILVLINNTDWELEGEGEYVLQPNDEIVFISTLHGG